MLIEAAKGGHTTVVQLLLDYPNSFGLSASFDLVDSSGQIPLQPPLATTPTDLGAQSKIFFLFNCSELLFLRLKAPLFL